MLRKSGTRRAIALIGILLGLFFAGGVVWSVLTGQAEWWSLLLLLPVLVILFRLYAFWSRQRR